MLCQDGTGTSLDRRLHFVLYACVLVCMCVYVCLCMFVCGFNVLCQDTTFWTDSHMLCYVVLCVDGCWCACLPASVPACVCVFCGGVSWCVCVHACVSASSCL